MYRLIGCPMHLGVSDTGLKESIRVLNGRYPDFLIREIRETILSEEGLKNLKNLNSITETCLNISREVDHIIRAKDVPIFFGGDHAASIGSVSGAAKNIDNLGLIWIDSHSDINTDKTTYTGNIHGMPVSALLGYGEKKLRDIIGDKSKILPQNVVLFGLRDVDPPEADIIRDLNIRAYYFDEIIDRGLGVCLDEVKEYLKERDKLHISFDLDSMDPDIIKGVTVPVKSGFREEHILEIFDYLLREFSISSIDIVEYNPKYDLDFYTAEFTHLLTKKILNS